MQVQIDPCAANRLEGLGIIPQLVGAAAGLLAGDQPVADMSPAGADLPGTNPSVPRQPGATTTVSPAIQAQISPQISPTMVMQQDSPGATVGAAPAQIMPGGLRADTGVTPGGNWGAPGFPGVSPGISPLQPYSGEPGGYFPVEYGMPAVPSVVAQQGGMPGWVLPVAAVAGIGLIAAVMMGRRR